MHCNLRLKSVTLRLIVCILVALTCPAWSQSQETQAPRVIEARWWKGNLHTHTLWSDGNGFPEMVADWYREHGYHFLALSDHNVLSEGLRWMPEAEVARRSGQGALAEYEKRFGGDWVEIRPTTDGSSREVRLKPFSEYRALVEERGRFLMIPGEEITDSVRGAPVHLNATNIAELIRPLGGMTVQEAIAANVRAVEEQAKATGREIMVHLNHPNFGLAITAEDLAAVVNERFFEVYNGHPGVRHLGDAAHPSVERLWDIANTLRVAQLGAPPLFGLATDDSHDYFGHADSSRPGRGWVMVRAGRLTPEVLIRAMKRGDFYASSGVTLSDIRWDAAGGTLALDIEPVQGEEYVTRFVGTLEGYDATSRPATAADGEPARASREYSQEVGQVLATAEGTRASYRLTGKELYVRAIVTSSQAHHDPSFDGQRKQAWTQPVGWERRSSDGKLRPAQQ